MTRASCLLDMMESTVKDYLRQIPRLDFTPVDIWFFEELLKDGWPQENNDVDPNHYSKALLQISQEDKTGLILDNDEVVEKFNEFDIQLKKKYGLRTYLDLIDHNQGKVWIVRWKK